MFMVFRSSLFEWRYILKMLMKSKKCEKIERSKQTWNAPNIRSSCTDQQIDKQNELVRGARTELFNVVIPVQQSYKKGSHRAGRSPNNRPPS